MQPNPAIEIEGLKKRYGPNSALDGLTMAIPQGALAGFVGLNGAGKTTTLRILLQMATPDSGEAGILGLDALDRVQSLEIRRRTAFIPEGKALFPYMTVGDAVAFTKSFYPKWRVDWETRLARDFGLSYERKIPQLSKGTLTKLHLLLAFCRGAELLLLDEPTDGLDPLGVEVVLQALVRLVGEEGTTVLFSSHRLNEMEQIADYLCMIHAGRALMSGPLDDLKAECRRIVMVFAGDADMSREFESLGAVKQVGRNLTVLARRGADPLAQRARQLGAVSVEVQPLTLRELFLEVVKGEAL